ncbi:MAG: hypothetical protein Kow0029_26940 [Candidatus Rifleibacteriota bacterium]
MSEEILKQIRAKNPFSNLNGAEIFEIDTVLIRLVSLLAIVSYISIWTTGFLRPLSAVLITLSLFVLILGRGILSYPKLIQMLSFVVFVYAFRQYKANMPGIVVVLEFTAMILFLQLQILTSSIAVSGALVLSLMIILAVAAMNVNFLFPLSLFPYLLILFITLQKIAMLRHEKIAPQSYFNHTYRFSVFPGFFRFIWGGIFFFMLWLVFFYTVPRTESYGLASDTSRRRLKGFSGNLKIGEGGLLEDNPAVVMRVKPTDRHGMSVSVLRRLRTKLLRGTTFATYSNGQWERNQIRRYYVDLRKTRGEFELIHDFPAGKPLYQLEINLENIKPPVIFFPDQTVNAEFDASFIAFESDGSTYFLDKGTDRRRYLVRLLLDPLEVQDSLVKDITLTGSQRVYLSTANIEPRIKLLAGQIASGSETIHQRVEATMAYLLKNCSYSLFENFGQDIDPVLHFLFYSKAGSCEHFASAMTLLLRCMGIPARPVNGYTMGDWNELGNFFTVRQRNAHTWVEVFFPKSGWVPFDPSPPDEFYEPEGEVGKLFKYLWEFYEGQWFNYVYNFDYKTQAMGYRRIAGAIEVFYASWKKLPNIITVVIGASILLLGIFLIFSSFRRKRRKSWIPEWYLSWAGGFPIKREPWETPSEFHDRLITNGYLAASEKEILKQIEKLVDISGLYDNSAEVNRENALKLIKLLRKRI